MKPGNLAERSRCQIRRQREMRIRYNAHRVFGVRFYFVRQNKKPGRRTADLFRHLMQKSDLEIHKAFLRLPFAQLPKNLWLTVRQSFLP